MDDEKPPEGPSSEPPERPPSLIPPTKDEWEPPPEFDGYQLRGCIGKGGMGYVYTATEKALSRVVAIKFIDVAMRSNGQLDLRFLLEAQAGAQLQHPNVVAIYRVGEIDGHPYIASEWVQGQTLAELALPLPGPRALQIGVGIARGLAAVHQHKVLHRDIKPGNVIVADSGEAKLLDFGLAKFVGETNGTSLESNVLAEANGHGNGRFSAPAEEDPNRTQELRSESSMQATAELTQRGVLIGTPAYVAPEIWRGEVATFRSDVYSVGAVLYQLCAGRPPHVAKGMDVLKKSVLETDPAPLTAVSILDQQLAAIIHRCLSRDPALRYATAVELRDALEGATPERRALTLPEGNPYRGLQAFEATHRALFFGRRTEIRAVLDQLREDAFTLVLGPSGVGKSSLCRAGVLPWMGDFGLFDERQWTTMVMTPGKRPVSALAAAIAPYLGLERDDLTAKTRGDWEAVYSELLRQRAKERGPLLIFIDQFEELATLSNAEEAAVMARVVESFSGEPEPSLRLLATLRADFLVRVGWLPGMSNRLTRTAYLLKPMTPEGIREAIVGPAKAKGVEFESSELVDALVKSTAEAEGALPLLQFTLAELWDARDATRNVIGSSALEATGGVTGALARHADRVLARLPPEQRAAARRLLPLLVTLQETRARQTERDLGAENETDRAALGALVQGRLLTATESPEGPAYEVAHEALINSWPTLRQWLEEDSERRKLRDRLSTSISEWERLGRKREGLWSARQLNEVAALLDRSELLPRERIFLDASFRAVRFKRRLSVGIATGLVLALAATYLGVNLKARRDLTAQVEAFVNNASSLLSQARAKNQETEQLRRQAFSLFDNKKVDQGEEVWTKAGKSSKETDKLYGEAGNSLEAAIALGRESANAKAILADVLYERALLADRDERVDVREELLARLPPYDDTTRKAKWVAPAKLHLESTPSGAEVMIQQYRLRESQNPVLETWGTPLRTPVAQLLLPPGSYLLILKAQGTTTVRLPLLLKRGEERGFSLDLPRASSIPKGYVYVPPGPFLFGSSNDRNIRKDYLNTVPLHEITTGPYLIAEHETTFGDWLEYLNRLTPPEMSRRAAAVAGVVKGSLSLRRVGQEWELAMHLGPYNHVMRPGDVLNISERRTRQAQNWLRLPMVGISVLEIAEYVSWLGSTSDLIQPRLCSELEWERAARGADGREYPQGNFLSPGDANYGESYGSKVTTAGPDEVGSHPESRSPYGVDDMCGNAFEFTRSSLTDGEYVLRGGAFHLGPNEARTSNRQTVPGTQKTNTRGFRVCGDLKR